jgi:hypothetical protein
MDANSPLKAAHGGPRRRRNGEIMKTKVMEATTDDVPFAALGGG